MSKKVVLKNVKIGYRNFSGIPGTFNLEGRRTFSVFLTDEQTEELRNLGCPVRIVDNKNGVKFNILIVRVLCPSDMLFVDSLKPDVTVKIKGQKDVPIDLNEINVLDSLTIYGANLTINIIGKYKLPYLSCGEFKVSKSDMRSHISYEECNKDCENGDN